MKFTAPSQAKSENPAPDLESLLQEEPTVSSVSLCSQCPLAETCQPLSIQGQGKLKILVVISNPTKGDTDMGKYVASQAYTRIKADLYRADIDIEQDCWVTSAVRGRPVGQAPSKKEFDCCRNKLYNTVQHYKPWVVIIAGRNPMYGWKGHLFSIPPQVPDNYTYKTDVRFEAWVGHHIPDDEYSFNYRGEKVCPVVVPVFNAHDVSKAEKANMRRPTLDSIIPIRQVSMLKGVKELALSINADPAKHIRSQKAIFSRHSKIVVVKDIGKAIQVLKGLSNKNLIAFDYETTGLKPFNKGHKIVMVSISDGVNSYAMPFFYNTQLFLEAFKNIMVNPKIRKICHHVQYEYVWTRAILGYEIENVFWDTMIVAHILDMRDSITGLKVQNYLNFGTCGYDKRAKKLMTGTPEKKSTTNSLNWLQFLDPYNLDENKLVWDELLEYNAQDSSLTYALYWHQKRALANTDTVHLMKGIKLFMETTLSLADMEYNGLLFDKEACVASNVELTELMKDLKKDMFGTEEYGKWTEAYKDKEINLNSPKQLQDFFFTLLGYKSVKSTKSNLPSTDQEALEKLATPFSELLLKYKTFDKLKSSFLKSYLLETNDDGYIRCFYGLNGVKSYRTSASKPNFTQVSKRSEYSGYVRKTLRAHPGHVLIEADFKALEVGVNACINHDESLVAYVTDETKDMHRDTACDILFYDHEDLPKAMRTLVKSGFVFSQFYGAGYKSCAFKMWFKMGGAERKRLSTFGIKSYDDFEEHVKQMAWKFWNVRFKGYTRWKTMQWKFYTHYGYVVGHTGFIYDGVMNSRQVSNFPPQGDASHLLLWTVNRMRDFIRKNKMKTLMVGEVHDSQLYSCPQEEVPLLLEEMHRLLVQVRVEWPWLIVPFTIEVEQSDVDGYWGDMVPIAKCTESGVELIEKKK